MKRTPYSLFLAWIFTAAAALAQVTIDWADVSKTGSSLAQLQTRNFSDLQNRPTTLSGYGITDAAPRADPVFSGTITGSTSVLGDGQLEYVLRFGRDSGWSLNRFATTYSGGQTAVAELVGLHHNYDRSIPNRPKFGMRFEENYDISANPGPFASALSEFYWEWKEPSASGERYVRPLYMTIVQPAASAQNPANYGSAVFSGRVGLDWWANDWRMGRRFRDNLSDPNTDNQWRFWVRWDMDGAEAADGIAALYLRDNHKLDVGGFSRLRGGVSIGNTHATTLASSATAARTITLPDANGTVLLANGNGSALTNLNASAITSGTIDPARLPPGAAVPLAATATQERERTSTTTFRTPALARIAMMDAARHVRDVFPTDASLRQLVTSNSGTAVTGSAAAAIDLSTSTTAGGTARWAFCTGSINNTGFSWHNRQDVAIQKIPWSRPVSVAFRIQRNTWNANTSGFLRAYLGTPSTAANYTLSNHGIGIHITATRQVRLVAHNGTTLTESANLAEVLVGTNTLEEFLVESDGAGSVTLWRGPTYLGAITGGPTTENPATNHIGASVEIGNGGESNAISVSLGRTSVGVF